MNPIFSRLKKLTLPGDFMDRMPLDIDYAKLFTTCTGLANIDTLCLCWVNYSQYQNPKLPQPQMYTVDLRYQLRPTKIIIRTINKNFCKELRIITLPGHDFSVNVAPVNMIFDERIVISNARNTGEPKFVSHIFKFKDWVNSKNICRECETIQKYLPIK